MVKNSSLKKIKAYWRYFRRFRNDLRLDVLRFFLRLVPSESQRVFILTLIVGAVCGVVAVSFHLSILWVEGLLIDRAMDAPAPLQTWLTIFTPAFGGLIGGILLYYVVPGARGSGIPQVKVAYEIKGGRLPFRDAVGKFVIGALQIGSGGSLGREGPTVHICAGVASALGRVAALSQNNLRRMLPVGAAAGIAAAFNAPIAAVTFTIEEVVGDLDQTILSGVIVAAAIAAAIERGILGEHPVFTINQNYGLNYASSLFWYAILGIVAAFVSLLFSEGLLKVRKWFGQLHWVPVWARPAVGGLVTGILAIAAIYFLDTRGVTGGGYATLSLALSASLPLKVMAALCLMKLAATVFSYSSGGAGGIFAPSLFVGGMLGGVVGFFDVHFFNHPENQIGAFALVGMGAVFAGVVRAPITSVLIIFEMTGSYGLILPLMIANMTSYAIAKHFRGLPIYEALLVQDNIHLPHRSKKDSHALEKLTVAEAMTRNPVTIHAGMSLTAALEKVQSHDFPVLPVIETDGRCVGLITRARLERNIAEKLSRSTVREIAAPAAHAFPDWSLSRAIVEMHHAQQIKLCVVERHSHNKLIGILTMSDVVRAQAEVLDQKENPHWSAVPNLSEPA